MRGSSSPPQAPREGSVPYPFPLWTGIPSPPIRPGAHVLLRLDFHDLASNFILNILAFIFVCEAFLRIKPHFGLWLKTFNVKPKVVGGH